MSNNNLKNCLTALEQLNLTDKVEVTVGKNPKQATRLSLGDTSVSVSALYKIEDFINLLECSLKVNSVASSKYNECNADNEYMELTMWLDREATYAKKCMYNYKENNLNSILMWTCEDFGYTFKQITKLYENWNNDADTKKKISLKTNKDLIYKNGYYVANSSLYSTCKEWLSAHGLYEKWGEYIPQIIDKWVRIGGQ